MRKVSVIIPFVMEWPQIAFTVRAIREELKGFCEHEIIVADNYCPEVESQGVVPDRGHDQHIVNKVSQKIYLKSPKEEEGRKLSQGHMKAQAGIKPWLKYCRYDKKLSHWQAKNLAVKQSTGALLLFVDAHVMPSKNSLRAALESVNYFNDIDNGWWRNTVHMPLSYHILEDKRLIYKLVWEPNNGNCHYSFGSFGGNHEYKEINPNSWLREVPCMSTCGMIMTRRLFETLGGWPSNMGIYGGGEHFMNFVSAICGSKKFVSTYGCLHHHGDRRKYHFNYDDYHRNRMTATVCFGGKLWLNKYRIALAGPSNKLIQKYADRIEVETLDQRDHIDLHKVMSIEQWAEGWVEGYRRGGD